MMGSLRNPAAWNGVYGFRPTVGLVPGEPRDGVFQHRLSTFGPMARNLEDLEALLVTLSGGAHSPLAAIPGRAPRVGWLGDWGGAFAMEPGLMDLAEGALAVMGDLGWQVEPMAPPADAAMLWDSWTDLRSFTVGWERGALYHDPVLREGLNAQAIWEIERGLAMTGDQVARAAALRDAWLAVVRRVFETVDCLVLPSTQVWPFAVHHDWPTQIAGRQMDTYHRWMEAMVPASLAGLPVVNLPAGHGPEGLPAGIQVIGRSGSDARLLAWARAYEAAIGPRVIVEPHAAQA